LKKLQGFWARGLVAAAALALALAGCGGGGGGSSSEPPAPQSLSISGVAAEGAPMEGAAVRIFDATGAEVATATAGSDGSYTLTVPATAKAPFVVSATKGDLVYYSPVAEAKSGTVNVTKLTNLIAAQLSPTGDPAALATQIASGAVTVDAAQVQQVVTAIVEALRPLLTAAGDTLTDPISGTFSANGTGHDQVLMALDVAINPAGTSSNITVTVKVVVADGEQPPAISFTSGSTPPPLPQMVATAELPSSDTDAVVAAFLARLEACYALPKSERVNGTTASSVIATACRTLFSGDDPTTFKNNGGTVGANGAFSGLFRDGATGVKFTNPVIEFLIPDGKMLVGWKNTDTAGGVTYSRVWAKRENGALKAIGNQYQYPFTVRAWSETRSLVNTPALSYWATGYDVSIGNLGNGSGGNLFAKVVVTSPNGRQTTFVPSGSLSYIPVQGTNTSVLRLAGKFIDPATSGVPRRMSGFAGGEGLVWASTPDGATSVDWSEDQIKAINNIGRWKAEFYLASAPTVIAATQYHETMTRPLTISELVPRQWAALTAPALQAVVAESASTGNIALAAGEVIDLSVDGSPTDFWTVPTGALGPTFVQAQGFLANAGSPAPRFNDNTNVSSTARTAVIKCSTQSGSDAHCSSPTATTYSGDARLNLLQLFAFDGKDMEWVSMVGTYKLSVSP
jgi:hypothetical protein